MQIHEYMHACLNTKRLNHISIRYIDACMHADVHTYTNIHAHIHADPSLLRPSMDACMQCTQRMRKYVNGHWQAYIHTCITSYMHTATYIPTTTRIQHVDTYRIHTYSYIHAYIRTCTYCFACTHIIPQVSCVLYMCAPRTCMCMYIYICVDMHTQCTHDTRDGVRVQGDVKQNNIISRTPGPR